MNERSPHIIKIVVDGFRCLRCEHEWVPMDIQRPPRICPKCKSAYWDRPRKPKAPDERKLSGS